jgi:hypothetical protein
MSIILLTGAFLLGRGLYGLRTFDAGFRRDHLLIATPEVAKAIPNPADQLRFEQQLISRISALPGVRSVSTSTLLPSVRGFWMADYTADGYVSQSKEDATCYLNFVSPRYFETMGISFLLGRQFLERDEQPGAPGAAIVSDSLARHFWGKENPIGKRIHELEKSERLTVIGVVRDAKYRTFREGAPRTIYLRFPPPVIGMAWNAPMEIWTNSRPETLISAVRSVFQSENSQVAVEFQTFDELIDRRLLSERLLTVIAICFGALGLSMAAIGIYGVAERSNTEDLRKPRQDRVGAR